MSWSRTYTHTLAIAVDMTTASIFWNQEDVTVSTLCRLVQLADAGVDDFLVRLAALELSAAQIDFLRWLAPRLDRLQANHCELARQADAARAAKTIRLTALKVTAAPK
jgi:hypothetical protein